MMFDWGVAGFGADPSKIEPPPKIAALNDGFKSFEPIGSLPPSITKTENPQAESIKVDPIKVHPPEHRLTARDFDRAKRGKAEKPPECRCDNCTCEVCECDGQESHDTWVWSTNEGVADYRWGQLRDGMFYPTSTEPLTPKPQPPIANGYTVTAKSCVNGTCQYTTRFVRN
jgi:hypothetical protein